MMAIKTFLGILILALIFAGCSASKDLSFASAEVVLLSNQGYETLTLRSTGYGNNKEESTYNAEKLAFENLFFRGVPNSNFKKPLLGLDREDIESKNQEFFNRFYRQQMKTFIASSFQSTPFQKSKKTTITTVDIKINVAILKKFLEQKKMIRKFGL